MHQEKRNTSGGIFYSKKEKSVRIDKTYNNQVTFYNVRIAYNVSQPLFQIFGIQNCFIPN